jgi:hypothetical protein
VTPDILEGVIIDEDMLGNVPQLKYENHDITNTMKFSELAPHHYLELKVDLETNQSIHVPQVWAKGLERVGLLNLFDIPHLRWRNKVNA